MTKPYQVKVYTGPVRVIAESRKLHTDHMSGCAYAGTEDLYFGVRAEDRVDAHRVAHAALKQAGVSFAPENVSVEVRRLTAPLGGMLQEGASKKGGKR